MVPFSGSTIVTLPLTSRPSAAGVHGAPEQVGVERRYEALVGAAVLRAVFRRRKDLGLQVENTAAVAQEGDEVVEGRFLRRPPEEPLEGPPRLNFQGLARGADLSDDALPADAAVEEAAPERLAGVVGVAAEQVRVHAVEERGGQQLAPFERLDPRPEHGPDLRRADGRGDGQAEAAGRPEPTGERREHGESSVSAQNGRVHFGVRGRRDRRESPSIRDSVKFVAIKQKKSPGDENRRRAANRLRLEGVRGYLTRTAVFSGEAGVETAPAPTPPAPTRCESSRPAPGPGQGTTGPPRREGLFVVIPQTAPRSP